MPLDRVVTTVPVNGTELSAIQAAVEDTGAGYTPTGSHTTVGTLTTAQTITPPSGAVRVALQAFGQAVRYTLDGTTPTASTGFRLAANEYREVPVAGGANIKVIEEAAGGSVQWQAIA